MNWACSKCGTLHTQNPKECRNCGRTALKPISDSGLPNADTSGPAPLETDQTQTFGTEPEPEYESSPDVSVDGSIDADERPREERPSERKSWFRGFLILVAVSS